MGMKGHEKEIIIYLKENYCPTLDDETCGHNVEVHYPHMLHLVIDEFITRQARVMCYRMGYCDDPFLRKFTCDNRNAEMRIAKAILTGEDHIAEMVAFLQENCNAEEHPHCKKQKKPLKKKKKKKKKKK